MKENEKELGGPKLVLLVKEDFPEEVIHELRSCPGYPYCLINEPGGKSNSSDFIVVHGFCGSGIREGP